MKNIGVLLIILLSTTLAVSKVVSEEFVLDNSCSGYPFCIKMPVNFTVLSEKSIIETKEREGGYTEYYLKIKGNRMGRQQENHVLRTLVYTDGIECTDLGYAAVYGFSKNSNPIIQTKSGLLEVDKKYIDVGCADCFQILNKDFSVVKKLHTPAWDLRTSGLSVENISIDKNGTLFVQNQNTCLAYSNKSLFHVVRPNKCKVPKIIGDFTKQVEGIKIKAGQWLLKFEDHEKLALVNAGACT